MWQVNFDRHGSNPPGSLASSWQGTSEQTVICLLDPPRNAMPPENYREAQENVSRIYGLIPAFEPFIVGLQDDFWREADGQGLTGRGGELPDSYLERGGLGIVHALSRVEHRPQIVRLEDEDFYREYMSLQPRAVAFMAESAPFFRAITAAIEKAQNQSFTPPLAKLKALATAYHQESSISLAAYVRELRGLAGAHGVDLTAPRYETLLLYDGVALLEETAVKEEEVRGARNRLAMDINENVARGKFAPRAAWELYRYTLSNRYVEREENDAQAAQLDEMLRAESVPEPPAEVVEKASALVKERCLIDMRVVREGEDKADLLGDHGDAVSNLVELGLILGLDMTAYAVLIDYLRYSALQARMQARPGGVRAVEALSQSMLGLEGELERRLAQTENEKALLGLESVASFLESLGRFHLVYDENIRSTVMNLSTFEVCELLARLRLPVAAGWEDQARSFDARFEVVRDFYDQTILRAKDLASGLLSAMRERRVAKGLLYCDGYMREILERWFKGHDISNSFVIPSFKVPRLRG